MAKPKASKDVVATEPAAGGAGGGVSLGKGAFDCDNNVEIPPESEVSSQILAVLIEAMLYRARLVCSCVING